MSRWLPIVACVSLTGCGQGDDASRAVGADSAAPASAGQGVRLPDYERVELANGTVVLLAERHDVPLVALSATLVGGAVADPPGKAGLSSLTAGLLEKGAGGRNAQAFAEAVAAVGGVLSASSGVENVLISGEFLAADVDLMIELLSDMLLRPRFDEDEFDKLRHRAIELIKSAKDSDPRQLIGTYGGAFLFAGHPYGRPAGGDETSLATITRADVQAFYRDQLGGDRLILSVAGDFELTSMRARIEEAFGGWRRAAGKLPTYDDAPTRDGGRVLLVDKPDATQTYFWLGNVGVARGFAGRAPLDIVNTVFGGRFTSMLNTELRIKSGLTYGARSRISQPARRGSVAIVSFTATETTAEAIDMAIATLTRLHDEGLDEEATTSAKNYILGQDPLDLETSRQLAAQLATLEFYDLGRDYVDGYAPLIAGTTAEAIAAVIGEVYPRSDGLVMVLIGDAAAIRDKIRQYGEVTEIAITAPSFSP